MRDLVWTLIVVWLIYKVVEVFRVSAAKRNTANNHYQAPQSQPHHSSKPDKDIKDAVKKHLNNEGEYIDFEEVK